MLSEAARNAGVEHGRLLVELSNGRELTVPLTRFPRLLHGTAAERSNRRLIRDGGGFHWPDLDENMKVEGLIVGLPYRESQRFLQHWLDSRRDPAPHAADSRAGEELLTQCGFSSQGRPQTEVKRVPLRGGTSS